MDNRFRLKKGGRALFAIVLTAAAFFGGPAFREAARAQDKSSDRLVKAKEGGRVESPSGKASLVIPAGALQSDTRLSIREIPGEDVLYVGPAFELKPEGLKFLKPATLTIRFAAKDLTEGYGAEDLALSGEEAAPPAASPFGGLSFLETTADVSSGTVSAQVAHLSKYVLRAVSSYKLDTEQQFIHGTKKFFNIILPIRDVQGKGSVSAGCKPEGNFSVSAEVPLGQEGAAGAQAVGTKFFRVKPSAKGLREVQSVVEVEIVHSAHISDETNFYFMGYALTLGAWLPGNWIWSFTGWPEFAPRNEAGKLVRIYGQKSGRKYPGTISQEGIFNHNFGKQPRVQLPDLPEYNGMNAVISFQNCRLVAGRTYGLVIGTNAVVHGQKPIEENPPMGGQVSLYDTIIMRMTIKAQQ